MHSSNCCNDLFNFQLRNILYLTQYDQIFSHVTCKSKGNYVLHLCRFKSFLLVASQWILLYYQFLIKDGIIDMVTCRIIEIKMMSDIKKISKTINSTVKKFLKYSSKSRNWKIFCFKYSLNPNRITARLSKSARVCNYQIVTQ